VKKYVIDANALISFVTDRNLEQQKKITPFFDASAHLKSIILCHQHVLTEFVYVMDRIYQTPKIKIAQIVSDFIDMPGIEIIREVNFNTVFTCWPNPISDFGDAVIASAAMVQKGSIIVTFDRKFTKFLKSLKLEFYRFN
jgi:predicted nucleic-acid-binding protein